MDIAYFIFCKCINLSSSINILLFFSFFMFFFLFVGNFDNHNKIYQTVADGITAVNLHPMFIKKALSFFYTSHTCYENENVAMKLGITVCSYEKFRNFVRKSIICDKYNDASFLY